MHVTIYSSYSLDIFERGSARNDSNLITKQTLKQYKISKNIKI